jgi:hypothetical protein
MAGLLNIHDIKSAISEVLDRDQSVTYDRSQLVDAVRGQFPDLTEMDFKEALWDLIRNSKAQFVGDLRKIRALRLESYR